MNNKHQIELWFEKKLQNMEANPITPIFARNKILGKLKQNLDFFFEGNEGNLSNHLQNPQTQKLQTQNFQIPNSQTQKPTLISLNSQNSQNYNSRTANKRQNFSENSRQNVGQTPNQIPSELRNQKRQEIANQTAKESKTLQPNLPKIQNIKSSQNNSQNNLQNSSENGFGNGFETEFRTQFETKFGNKKKFENSEKDLEKLDKSVHLPYKNPQKSKIIIPKIDPKPTPKLEKIPNNSSLEEIQNANGNISTNLSQDFKVNLLGKNTENSTENSIKLGKNESQNILENGEKSLEIKTNSETVLEKNQNGEKEVSKTKMENWQISSEIEEKLEENLAITSQSEIENKNEIEVETESLTRNLAEIESKIESEVETDLTEKSLPELSSEKSVIKEEINEKVGEFMEKTLEKDSKNEQNSEEISGETKEVEQIKMTEIKSGEKIVEKTVISFENFAPRKPKNKLENVENKTGKNGKSVEIEMENKVENPPQNPPQNSQNESLENSNSANPKTTKPQIILASPLLINPANYYRNYEKSYEKKDVKIAEKPQITNSTLDSDLTFLAQKPTLQKPVNSTTLDFVETDFVDQKALAKSQVISFAHFPIRSKSIIKTTQNEINSINNSINTKTKPNKKLKKSTNMANLNSSLNINQKEEISIKSQIEIDKKSEIGEHSQEKNWHKLEQNLEENSDKISIAPQVLQVKPQKHKVEIQNPNLRLEELRKNQEKSEIKQFIRPEINQKLQKLLQN